MDFKNLIKWSAILAALLAFKKLNADEITEGEQQDHLAYMLLLKEAGEAQPDEHADLVNLISEHLNFSEERSQLFFEYLVTSNESLQANNQAITERMLCNNPDRGGDDEVYALLDTLQDIRNTNLRKHYRHAMASIGFESSDRLTSWLEDYKPGILPVVHDHKALYESIGMNAESVVGASCNQIAANFRTQRPVNY